MDVDGRRHVDESQRTSTVDQVEKSRMVDVDRKKVCGVDGQRWPNKKNVFLYFEFLTHNFEK